MKILNIPDQIFNGSLTKHNLNKVDAIVLHHAAHTSASVKDIESWHISQGWTAIGYNYIVDKDGNIYEGRGFNLPSGVAGHNSHTMSICFVGDYHTIDKVMPDVQFNAGVDIINYVISKLPQKVKIIGHRDLMATGCPGQYFPLEEMSTLKKRKAKLSMSEYEELKEIIKGITPNIYNWTEGCPKWSIPYVQKALDLGYIKGDENGYLGLTDDRIWSLVVMLRMNGIMD